MAVQYVTIDTLRTVAHGSIGNTYAALGGVLTSPGRLICITNNTDGDMLFSDDGVNDKLFVAAGSFKLFDIATNKVDKIPIWCFAVNTQFYVKYSTAPTKNSVYLEVLSGGIV